MSSQCQRRPLFSLSLLRLSLLTPLPPCCSLSHTPLTPLTPLTPRDRLLLLSDLSLLHLGGWRRSRTSRRGGGRGNRTRSRARGARARARARARGPGPGPRCCCCCSCGTATCCRWAAVNICARGPWQGRRTTVNICARRPWQGASRSGARRTGRSSGSGSSQGSSTIATRQTGCHPRKPRRSRSRWGTRVDHVGAI